MYQLPQDLELGALGQKNKEIDEQEDEERINEVKMHDSSAKLVEEGNQDVESCGGFWSLASAFSLQFVPITQQWQRSTKYIIKVSTLTFRFVFLFS